LLICSHKIYLEIYSHFWQTKYASMLAFSSMSNPKIDIVFGLSIHCLTELCLLYVVSNDSIRRHIQTNVKCKILDNRRYWPISWMIQGKPREQPSIADTQTEIRTGFFPNTCQSLHHSRCVYLY